LCRRKVPKPVQAAREALRGIEVTADNLKKYLLSPKELNNLASNFRHTMMPKVKYEYGKLKSDADKRSQAQLAGTVHPGPQDNHLPRLQHSDSL
jgi:hypothetical protein